MSFNKTNHIEADNVFVLMTNEYRVSRNIRAQWYFNNLNRTIELPNKRDLVSLIFFLLAFLNFLKNSSFHRISIYRTAFLICWYSLNKNFPI